MLTINQFKSDTILIAGKLEVDYIPYWQDVNTKPGDPVHEVAQSIVRTKKVIFTKTLDKSDPIAAGWSNTEIANENLADQITNLMPASNLVKFAIVEGTLSSRQL